MTFRLESVDGLLLLRCEALDEITGIAHAFSTRRHDGADDFDLGAGDDRSQRMRLLRERFLAAAGIDGDPLVLRQVHGLGVVDQELPSDDPPEADAAIWLGGARAPAVRTADCVPILIADSKGRSAAAVHAGWRGTAAGIAGAAVAALVRRGIQADSLVAALGPSIGPCCYEVGADVIAALGAEATVLRVDLRDVNRAQLIRAGLAADAIHVSPWCTRCRDDLFFSYRRDGENAGRMMAAVGSRRHP